MGMILVTGGSGLLGTAIQQVLSPDIALFPPRSELDYSCMADVDAYIGDNKVSQVIHLAAKVGGVKANIENQFSFYHDNSVMNNNILHIVNPFYQQLLDIDLKFLYLRLYLYFQPQKVILWI